MTKLLRDSNAGPGRCYQVVCTGCTGGAAWRTPISVHASAEEAVLAAAAYRSMYRRNFGAANPHGRVWAVERIRLRAAFEVPDQPRAGGLVGADEGE